jgi:diguanylate cyclase
MQHQKTLVNGVRHTRCQVKLEMLTQYLISTLNLAGMMALIALSFSGASKLISHNMGRQILYGLILGAGAVFVSIQPIMHVNGIQNDPRNLLVGCAAAIFGPVAGLITFMIAATTRYHEAAPSANVCVISLFVAGCAGLAWRQYTRNLVSKNEGHFAILGLTISLSYFTTFLLPREDWHGIFSTAVPVLTIVNVIGAVILGGFLERHRLRNERERTLLDHASFDPLTGLMNRRAFEMEYASSILAKSSIGTAFIVFDLDDFKNINDTYGHSFGDKVLVGVSSILRANIRDVDLSARFGGDEFILCLRNIDYDQSTRIIKRIQKAISELGRRELEVDLEFTASVGLCWREDPIKMKDAFEIADQSLYHAKVDGKNQMDTSGKPVFFDSLRVRPDSAVRSDGSGREMSRAALGGGRFGRRSA